MTTTEQLARPRVVVAVTCVGGRLIFDILRGLREAEDFDCIVVGTDADPNAHGRLLCDHFFVLPNARTEPDLWSREMQALIEEQGVQVLLSLSDAETSISSANYSAFTRTGAKCAAGNPAVAPLMNDKLSFLQTLTDAGIDIGPFAPVEGEDDLRAALTTLNYPDAKVVLKPRRSSGSRGVCIIDAQREGFEKLLPDRLCGTGPVDAVLSALEAEALSLTDLIAVPHYDGPVFDVDVIAKTGKVEDICLRLRQLRNPLWPTSTGHKVVLDERVLRYVPPIAEALGIDGAADLDVILSGGTAPRVIDGGARFSGSVGGAVTADANFPAQLVRNRLDMPRQPLRPKDGTVLRPYLTMAAIPPENEADYL